MFPYDGNDVGSQGDDRIQNILGNVSILSRDGAGFNSYSLPSSALYGGSWGLLESREGWAVGSGWPYASCNQILIDASRSVRTGHETNPAYIAVVVYISY